MANFMVTVQQFGYPVLPAALNVLVGIYPTKEAASFIVSKVQKKCRTQYDTIVITETEFKTTTDTVEDYLEKKKDRRINEDRQNYITE